MQSTLNSKLFWSFLFELKDASEQDEIKRIGRKLSNIHWRCKTTIHQLEMSLNSGTFVLQELNLQQSWTFRFHTQDSYKLLKSITNRKNTKKVKWLLEEEPKLFWGGGRQQHVSWVVVHREG